MLGRVSAVNVVFISSSNELGDFESGKTAAWFGPVASVVGGGVGTILVVLLAMWRWPSLLRLGPLHKPVEISPPTEDPYGAVGLTGSASKTSATGSNRAAIP
jgi:hypothetical protein